MILQATMADAEGKGSQHGWHQGVEEDKIKIYKDCMWVCLSSNPVKNLWQEKWREKAGKKQ